MKKITSFLLVSLVAFSALKAQDVINLSTTDNIATVLSAYTGSNVVLVIPAGYTNPQGTTAIAMPALTTGAKVTFRGDGSMPTLSLKGLSVPATTGINFSSVKFQNLTITGASADPTTNYVFNISSGTAFNVDSVIFSGCNISTFRSLVRFQSTNTTIDQKANYIMINNCQVFNTADYGVIYNNKVGGYFGPVVAKNSTFYGFGQNVFMCQTNTASVSISDCTFDNVVSTTTAKYIVDLNAQSSPIDIKNCIFGTTILGAKGFRTGGAMTISNCYVTSDGTGADSIKALTVTGSMSQYSGKSSALFKTPNVSTPGASFNAAADYTIVDATFAGKGNAGDPRWYGTLNSVSRTITSSFSVFPNPTTDIVNFDKVYAKIEMFDATGRLIKVAINVSSLNVYDISNGMYLVRSTDSNGLIAVQKLNKK